MVEPSAIVAVLGGGRGQRLGGAKPTTPLGGCPLICRPLAAADGAGLETIVVAKPSTRLPRLRERVLLEPDRPSHPLRGVLSALEHAASRSPAPDVVLLACDMPFLTGPLLVWLASLDGAAMAVLDGRPQPLLARCPPDRLSALEHALDERRSLTGAIEAFRPRLLREPELARFGLPERLCFNVNEAEDLRRAEEWL